MHAPGDQKRRGRAGTRSLESGCRCIDGGIERGPGTARPPSRAAREDELRAAEAQVTVAEAKLLLAQTELERTRLLAQSPGQILEVKFHAGELIELQNQPPVITMADTSRLPVRAYVEELDAANVKPGMLAKITADGMPGRVIEGQVVEVMPRMSFKQVWTDRPDERFDVKTREVLIELRDARDHALARAGRVESRGRRSNERRRRQGDCRAGRARTGQRRGARLWATR